MNLRVEYSLVKNFRTIFFFVSKILARTYRDDSIYTNRYTSVIVTRGKNKKHRWWVLDFEWDSWCLRIWFQIHYTADEYLNCGDRQRNLNHRGGCHTIFHVDRRENTQLCKLDVHSCWPEDPVCHSYLSQYSTLVPSASHSHILLAIRKKMQVERRSPDGNVMTFHYYGK